MGRGQLLGAWAAGRLLGGDLSQVSREGCQPCLEPHHQGQYLPRASVLTHEQEGDKAGASHQLEASTGLVCVFQAEGLEVGWLGDILDCGKVDR